MYIESQHVNLYKSDTINAETYNMMDIPIDSIKFDSRYGKWSAVSFASAYFESSIITNGPIPISRHIALFALFEHDTLGDLTDYVLAFFDWYSGANQWVELCGTYDDIHTTLADLDLIDSYIN